MLRFYVLVCALFLSGVAHAGTWAQTCSAPTVNQICEATVLWQRHDSPTMPLYYLRMSSYPSGLQIGTLSGLHSVWVCPDYAFTGTACASGEAGWGALNFVPPPPPPPPDPLVCVSTDTEMACLTRRVNALIEQVSPAEPYDAISGFGFFSLTMGGVLFTYFFSIGIGLIFKAVKEW